MDQLPSALLHQRASVIRWLDGRMRGCNIKGLTKPVSGGKEARNVSPVTLKLTMFIWSWPVWHLAYYQCPYGWCFNCQSPSAVPLGRKTWRLSAMLFQGRANVSIALVFLLALLHPNIFKNSTCKHLHFFNEHGLGYVRIKISKFLVFLAERKQRFCLNCISGGATNQQFHNDCNCVWQNASPKMFTYILYRERDKLLRAGSDFSRWLIVGKSTHPKPQAWSFFEACSAVFPLGSCFTYHDSISPR